MVVYHTQFSSGNFQVSFCGDVSYTNGISRQICQLMNDTPILCLKVLNEFVLDFPKSAGPKDIAFKILFGPVNF